MPRIPDTPAAGMALMACGVSIAPVMDVCAKILTDTMSPGSVAFWRFIAQLCVLAPLFLLPRRWVWPGRYHVLGGLSLAVALVSIAAALRVMPVANVIAIFFVEPLILTLMSAYLLGEGLGWRRLTAVGIGLAGAMIVIRPSWEAFGVASLYPLITAFAFASYLLCNRVMRGQSDRIVLQFWLGAFALGALSVAIAFGEAVGVGFLAFDVPGEAELPYIVLMGLIAAGGHQLVMQGVARAEAAALAPIQYLEIIAAVLLGWAVFGDLPDLWTWVGTGVIVAAGLFVFIRERRLPPTRRAHPPAPTPR
ncbi:MAG TPA: EamA family transporter [Thermohalobaculum sp.]|nr:EamA family transporter [Thermohalobaculum sp.]